MLLQKFALVHDVIALTSAAAVLVAKFPSLAAQFGAVATDLAGLVMSRSFDDAQKLVADVKTAFEAFTAAYARDDASVEAFVGALEEIRADARGR